MEITPRYDGPPVITLTDGDDVGEPCIRQRRRFQSLLESLDDDAWQARSRCDEWTVQDVAAHLEGVNRFWSWSITAGLAGEPTRVLVGFDPKATPAGLVAAARSATPAETLDGLVRSTDELCDLVGSLDGDGWSTIAEAPAGHLPIRLLVHHALWDNWVHERDVALPLGLPVAEEPDEVMAGLRFAAALGPAFAMSKGRRGPATLVLETTGPDGCVVVEVTGEAEQVVVHDRRPDDPTLVVRGRAVDLLEAVSCRVPLDRPVPDEHRWLVASLGVVFETT